MQQLTMKAPEIAPGRWRDILLAAGMDANYLKKQEGPCPLCGGNTRFTYYDRDEKGGNSNVNGFYFCRHCGGGNGFKLLQGYLGFGFKQAASWIEEWFYGQPIETRIQPIPVSVASSSFSESDILKRKLKHKSLWNSSRAVVEGDPVWKYLCNRIPGFNASMISPMLRCHPCVDYYEAVGDAFKKTGTYPAMIAFIMAADGSCQDLHRTYLTKDGMKAPVGEVKKTLASIGVKGGAIQLAKPTGNVLAVAEGIESAYAVEIFKKLPCWSLLNTSGMKNFVIPSGIKYLHIFADNDKPDNFGVKPGTKAALALKENAEKQGVIVKITTPTTVGTDILDLLVGIRSVGSAM